MRLALTIILFAALCDGQTAPPNSHIQVIKFDPPCKLLGICTPEHAVSAAVQVFTPAFSADYYEVTLTVTQRGETKVFSGRITPNAQSKQSWQSIWFNTGQFDGYSVLMRPVYVRGILVEGSLPATSDIDQKESYK